MTVRPPAATSWRLVEIWPTFKIDGSAAVAIRFIANGGDHVLSPDEAEDAAGRLLEAAKLARAGIGRDNPERSS